MSVNFNSISNLPSEVCFLVLSNLKEKDLATCCQLSKLWNTLASDNRFWEEKAKHLLNGEVPKASHIKTFLNKIPRYNQNILERVEEFVNRIALGQNGQFKCAYGIDFYSKTPRFITVEIRGRQDKVKENLENLTDFDVQEEWPILYRPDGCGFVMPYSIYSPRYRAKVDWSLRELHEHEIKVCVYARGFLALLTFPHWTNAESATDLETRILDLLERKVSTFADQAPWLTPFYQSMIKMGLIGFLGLYCMMKLKR